VAPSTEAGGIPVGYAILVVGAAVLVLAGYTLGQAISG
jgi:hypothetical protein